MASPASVPPPRRSSLRSVVRYVQPASYILWVAMAMTFVPPALRVTGELAQAVGRAAVALEKVSASSVAAKDACMQCAGDVRALRESVEKMGAQTAKR